MYANDRIDDDDDDALDERRRVAFLVSATTTAASAAQQQHGNPSGMMYLYDEWGSKRYPMDRKRWRFVYYVSHE